ncbi:hypothetical protein DSAG12_00100 [Promethearchaeum syntrophicum]|uniref:Uncharacterized protein n=1 Tax=Promethearchaeum syntrophicum TaxID=2594042 RepID=A0A5B9D5B1_9ARCH|nr:hypothetical protein [Candidatus Prometheoarchaeum syntrophicum]QEE14289.1 hypothetical protein DSAG12_00100 [Candidatus Prometheoarchaeum syntrophicum]
MSTDQDIEIASYIVRYMMTHERLSLDILKDKFNMDDLQIRKCLIRLYFRGQIYGQIQQINGGKLFLIFLQQDDNQNLNAPTLTLDQIIDWNINEFDLDSIKSSIKTNDTKILTSNDTETESFHQDMFVSTPEEIEISRSKETSQKDFISVEMRIGISTYKLCIRIHVKNASQDSITNSRLKFNFGHFLKYEDINPKHNVKLEESFIWVDIGKINAAQGKIFEIFFNQTQQKQIKFDGLMQYKSIDGFARVLRLYPIEIDTILPKFTAQESSIKYIKSFMKKKEIIKRIQGFGIPYVEDPDNAQLYLEKITEKYGFLQISKIDKENTKMSFYFAKTEVKSGENCEILVVPQIKRNVLAFYCCSPYEHLVVNVLRQLSYDFQSLLREKNLLEKDQNLINLNCIKCGNVLDIFPPENEFVACRFCQLLQKPW